MLAGLAAAVVLVVRSQLVQPQAAETVLVETAGALHLAGFGGAAPFGVRVAEGVGGAHPHPLEAGSGGPDVVVHLPAGPDAVLLVGPADCLDDLASDGQAEVRQAVQRLKRTCCRTEAPASQRGRPVDVRRAGARLKTPCSFHERLVEGPASPRPDLASASTSNRRHPGPSTVPLSTRTTTAASLREASRLKHAGGPSGSAVPHCGRLVSVGSVVSAADSAASGPSGSSTIPTPSSPPARSDRTVSTRRAGSAWA